MIVYQRCPSHSLVTSRRCVVCLHIVALSACVDSSTFIGAAPPLSESCRAIVPLPRAVGAAEHLVVLLRLLSPEVIRHESETCPLMQARCMHTFGLQARGRLFLQGQNSKQYLQTFCGTACLCEAGTAMRASSSWFDNGSTGTRFQKPLFFPCRPVRRRSSCEQRARRRHVPLQGRHLRAAGALICHR